MLLDQLLVAAPAADPSGVTPLDALGLFVGIPLLIIAVIVGAVYGARWRTLRSEGRPQARAAEPPPLTEPVLGRPDQPSRRLDREREEAEARRTDASPVPIGTAPAGAAPAATGPAGTTAPADDARADDVAVGSTERADREPGAC